jgi:hypothetical protein
MLTSQSLQRDKDKLGCQELQQGMESRNMNRFPRISTKEHRIRLNTIRSNKQIKGAVSKLRKTCMYLHDIAGPN